MQKEQSPREAGYSGGMNITDWMLYKAIAILVVIAIYGFWLGATGQTRGEPPDKH